MARWTILLIGVSFPRPVVYNSIQHVYFVIDHEWLPWIPRLQDKE